MSENDVPNHLIKGGSSDLYLSESEWRVLVHFLTRETLRNFFNATVCLTEHIQSLEMAPSISTGVLLINTSAKLMILTGGDDSICRLWAVGFIMDKDSDSKNKIWRDIHQP